MCVHKCICVCVYGYMYVSVCISFYLCTCVRDSQTTSVPLQQLSGLTLEQGHKWLLEGMYVHEHVHTARGWDKSRQLATCIWHVIIYIRVRS